MKNSSTVRECWLRGVAAHDHPRGPGVCITEMLLGRIPESAEEQALLDGYRARGAANPPVPQSAAYRD